MDSIIFLKSFLGDFVSRRVVFETNIKIARHYWDNLKLFRNLLAIPGFLKVRDADNNNRGARKSSPQSRLLKTKS